MTEVLVVGAGPSGSVAAAVLARAGVDVLLVDRAEFPRDKLCGDTVNPGALALLRRLDLARAIDAVGLRIDGMRVTGGRGVAIDARYPDGLYGRSLTRRDLDQALLERAIDAGARFEPRVHVKSAIVERGVVSGVVAGEGGARQLRARVTIAADGRRSSLAFGLGLARHAERPRRWAIGAYYEGVGGLSSLGEMHIRPGRYIGVAPLAGGLANLCVVVPSGPGDPRLADPAALVAREIARDRLLGDRFAAARAVRAPAVLGPLAVDAAPRAIDGLFVVGDAAGFIDPMTGDGLRFAVRGGELAAEAARAALERGWNGVHAALAARRRREFAGKWRFNRLLRALVASPGAVDAAAAGARLAPGLVAAIVSTAGDCALARSCCS